MGELVFGGCGRFPFRARVARGGLWSLGVGLWQKICSLARWLVGVLAIEGGFPLGSGLRGAKEGGLLSLGVGFWQLVFEKRFQVLGVRC